MRNSFSPARTPKFCQHIRHTDSVTKVCTFRNNHEGKHSFDVTGDADEEGDMPPRSCNGSADCPADFHHPACRTYAAEAEEFRHLGHDGVLHTLHRDGSVTSVDSLGRATHTAPDPLATDGPTLVLHTTLADDPVDEDDDTLTLDHDAVHHPSHYRTIPATRRHPEGIEAIDVTRWFPFAEGNVLKYLLRAGHKGDRLEDLRKARQYLDFAIEFEEEARINKGENNG